MNSPHNIIITMTQYRALNYDDDNGNGHVVYVHMLKGGRAN